MDIKCFTSNLALILDDVAIRQSTYVKKSLPVSYTSATLRLIEGHAHHALLENRGEIRTRNGQSAKPISVPVLLDTLLGNFDKAVWRHYAPCIDTETPKLRAFEQKLSAAVRTISVEEAKPGSLIDWVAAGEEWRHIIYRVQSVYARGAKPIQTETFFKVILASVRAGFVDEETGDRIRYASALLYATKLALVNWMRMTHKRPPQIASEPLSDDDIRRIYDLARFRHGRTPEILGRFASDFCSGLENVAKQASEATIVASETAEFLARDRRGVIENDSSKSKVAAQALLLLPNPRVAQILTRIRASD